MRLRAGQLIPSAVLLCDPHAGAGCQVPELAAWELCARPLRTRNLRRPRQLGIHFPNL